ncbi:hypothetical protein OIY81_3750 [Cryptosporidium canis]|nr:hypothetical protein OIY81_3750 [Cryptosporidium canis]
MLNRLYLAEKALSMLRSGRTIPYPEPHSSVKSQWDFLLQEMTWMSKDYYEERRWKIHAARRLSQMVQNYWKRRMLNLERHVSSKCSALIQSFWLGIADHVDPELVPSDLRPYTMVVQPAPVGEDGQANAARRRLFNYCVRQFEQGMYECGKLSELRRTGRERNREKAVESVPEAEVPVSPMSIDIDHDNEGCQWVVDEDLLLQLDPLVFVKTAVPQTGSSTDAAESGALPTKSSAGGHGGAGSSSGGSSSSGKSGGSSSKGSNNSIASKYSDVSDLFKEFSNKQEAVVGLNDHRRGLASSTHGQSIGHRIPIWTPRTIP